ncbi:MAG TPA: phytanoyl-CoA dioxygenase family protein [Alphaproteobacteria bacterium]|nr:phytanoyl-CoA dioxygenase family protein [Alphaproteobacteria bacterium]
MKLSPAQIAEFEEQGYLFLPEMFAPAEIELLLGELPGIFAQKRPEVIREKESEAPRSAFYVQTWNEPFGLLARHPRLVEPGMQLLGSDKLYMHQYKINAKAAFDGAVWQWHQDYATWFNDDDMPTPRAMNIALFLAEANEFNGPLMFIPKSHRRGRLEASHDVTTTSYPLWTCDNETIARLVAEGGIVAPKGKPGSMLLFHGNLVHASGSNLTPWSRWILYLSLNRCDNAIRRFKRPTWIANHDFTPIELASDDCLLDYARKRRSAAE